MAKTDLPSPGQNLHPGGIDDTLPVTPNLSFFRANGFAIHFGEITRLTGKKLLKPLGEPILAIHSDHRNAVWVQTPTQLILYSDFFTAFI